MTQDILFDAESLTIEQLESDIAALEAALREIEMLYQGKGIAARIAREALLRRR